MKRMICITLLMVLMIMVCGCAETFQCGWCMREVTQTPHAAKALGQEIKVCDDCYEALKEYSLQLE